MSAYLFAVQLSKGWLGLFSIYSVTFWTQTLDVGMTSRVFYHYATVAELGRGCLLSKTHLLISKQCKLLKQKVLLQVPQDKEKESKEEEDDSCDMDPNHEKFYKTFFLQLTLVMNNPVRFLQLDISTLSVYHYQGRLWLEKR